MNTQASRNQQGYVAPRVELLRLQQPLRLLVSVSMDAGFEDWEEAEEI